MAFKFVNEQGEVVDIATGIAEESVVGLTTDVNALANNITLEINRASSAEQANTLSIDNEIQRALSAEQTLENIAVLNNNSITSIGNTVNNYAIQVDEIVDALSNSPLLTGDSNVVIVDDKNLVLGTEGNLTIGYNSFDTSIVFSIPPRVSDENYFPTLPPPTVTPETHPLELVFNDYEEPTGSESWLQSIYSPIRAYEDLPAIVDLRQHNMDIDNQGSSGSCVANAAVSILEVLSERINRAAGNPGQYINFSFMFLYWELRKELGTTGSDNGSWPHDAFDEVKEHGVCEYDLWSKQSQGASTNATLALLEPNAAAYENALNYRIEQDDGYKSIDHQNLILDMKEALSKGLPVMVAMLITNDFYSNGTSGPLESHTYTGAPVLNASDMISGKWYKIRTVGTTDFTKYGSIDNQVNRQFYYNGTSPVEGDGTVADTSAYIGGHAMAALGYDDSLGGFIVENSWGSGWGDGGYFLLTYDTYEKDCYNGETFVTTTFMGHVLDGSDYIDYGANNDVHYKAGTKKCLSIINSATPHVELFHNGQRRLHTSLSGVEINGHVTAPNFIGSAALLTHLEDTGFGQDIAYQLTTKVDNSRVLTDVPEGALFTDTITTYVHPDAHMVSEISGLQLLLDAKVDNSRVLTDVPEGALFTDTNDNNYVTGMTYADGILTLQQNGGLPDLTVEVVATVLDPTTSPIVECSTQQRFKGIATITNWSSYIAATASITIVDAIGTDVVSSNEIEYDENGNITFPLYQLQFGNTYSLRVRTQEIGKSLSDTVESQFTKGETSFRYWRLSEFASTGQPSVMLVDWHLWAGPGMSGLDYPSIMISDNEPSPYVVSASHFYGTYAPYQAFDDESATAGTAWWMLLSPNIVSDEWLQIDLGTSITIESMILKSGALAGYNTSSVTVYGSDTGTFNGEETMLGTFAVDSNVNTTTYIG
jgi:hypothetical protein